MPNTPSSIAIHSQCYRCRRSHAEAAFPPIVALVASGVMLWLGAFAAAATPARFTGVWDNDSVASGDSLGSWCDSQCQPELAGRMLFDARNPVRWVRDNTVVSAKDVEAFVEFWVWDRLPGQVVALVNESNTEAETLPPHLLVAPALAIDRPNNKWGAPATNLRVPVRWVRRIVWQPVASRYQPNTVFYRDGRQTSYRRLRFAGESIRLLRDDGVEEVRLTAIAELHFPAADAWDAYFEQLAALDPDGKARIMQLETAQGLRVTVSDQRFQADFDAKNRGPDRNQDPERRWYHRVQPVWSVEPLWLPYGQIRLRRWFPPQRAPLSCFEPVASRRQSILGGSWQWMADGNVQGDPLEAGQRPYAWGFGVQATSELEFLLPECAHSFRTRLGMDRAAGEGGAARAMVIFAAGARKPLYESPLLVGAGRVLDTGPLLVGLPTGQAGRLVLRAEMAGDDRPEHADPLDIRAIFDWLEPELEFEPGRLRAEALRRAPRLIPCWQDWTVRSGTAAGSILSNYWDASPTRPAYRLGATAAAGLLTISRRIQVSAQMDHLAMVVDRGDQSSPSRIEVRVEGQTVREIDVPIRRGGQPRITDISLVEYRGRQITVELIQHGDDARSLVDWEKLELRGGQ